MAFSTMSFGSTAGGRDPKAAMTGAVANKRFARPSKVRKGAQSSREGSVWALLPAPCPDSVPFDPASGGICHILLLMLQCSVVELCRGRVACPSCPSRPSPARLPPPHVRPPQRAPPPATREPTDDEVMGEETDTVKVTIAALSHMTYTTLGASRSHWLAGPAACLALV